MTGPANPLVKTSATRLMEDTRRHFLAEIIARVPIERLIDVHLFTPIRQGGVETGVAVVTARRVEPTLVDVGDVADARLITENLPAVPFDDDAVAPPSAAVADATSDVAPPSDVAVPDAASPPVDADATSCDPTEAAAPEALVDDASGESRERHTVFTARYRLTIKGPDRGRWDADVVEEADAPLVTVDAVVRGVQRRAGDAAEPDRLDAETVERIVTTGMPM